MSRSGYSDDLDEAELNLWRGSVARAIRGKRGQKALREILAALDAMPEKSLAAESLVTADGEYCTLGVLGARRGIDLGKLDPEDWDSVAKAFDIAPALVREIVFENDEASPDFEFSEIEICGPMRVVYPNFEKHRRTVRVPVEGVAELRWQHMRDWVARQLNQEVAA